MTGRLDGKVAVVFGAGPNIGGTIAHFRAREGARVGATDIDEKTAGRTAEFHHLPGLRGLPLAGNAFEEADVTRMVEAVSSTIAPSTAS